MSFLDGAHCIIGDFRLDIQKDFMSFIKYGAFHENVFSGTVSVGPNQKIDK
jgi:hypothetical protein